MKIYTKKGDSGETSLIGGFRVPKNNIRIEAYGTVDELNSWIGLVRDNFPDDRTRAVLLEIQDRLFTMGSLLASGSENPKMKLPEIKEEDVLLLEKEIDEMNLHLPEMKHFILPGGNTTVSYCHIARCVCRRAERASTAVDQENKINPFIIKYLNRLSDYLFVLSRKIGQHFNSEELVWKPRI